MRGCSTSRRATIELFREQNDGAYMLLHLDLGLFGNIGQANYGAAKMGIAGLSRIIAMEGARNNVRSNCLAPVAWTRMTAVGAGRRTKPPPRAARSWPRGSAPTSRPASPWPWSPRAATNVSGQIFGARGDDIITLLAAPPDRQPDQGKPAGPRPPCDQRSSSEGTGPEVLPVISNRQMGGPVAG